MATYFIIFSILFFFALDDLRQRKFARKTKLIFLTIGLILFSGLRWRTGPDWLPYFNYFEYFDWNDSYYRQAFEVGYAYLTLFVHLFSNSYTVFLLLFSSLLLISRNVFFNRHTQSVFLAILLYFGFYLADTIATRQALAISICLLGVPYIEKKKFFHLLALVCLAMTIHMTAIIFLAAYPIYHKTWSVKTKILLLLFALIIGFTPLMQMFFELLGGFGGRIAEKAVAYGGLEGNEKYNDSVSEGEKTATMVSGILKRIIVLPFLLYIENRYKNFAWSKKYKQFMNLFVFGNVIYFIVMRDIALQRFAAYFYMFEIILLCMFIDNIPREKRPQWIIIFALYALLKLIFILTSAYGYLVPYYWIFDTNFYRESGLNF